MATAIEFHISLVYNQNMLKSPKKALIVLFNLFVGFLHLLTGENYTGPYPHFVNGYMIDILLPFAFYLLLTLIEAPFLKSWMLRFALIFGLATAVEISQAFGIPLFGQTFDPLDIAMYALGCILAALLDEVLLPRFSFLKKNRILNSLI